MGKKQEVLEELFLICQQRNNFVFDNYLVKEVCEDFGFRNPFDATKVDRSDLYPDVMKRGRGFFVIHLGRGRHQFIPDIASGYHEFEEIEEHESKTWSYQRSLLNDFDTSESNIISVGINQRILHDFLYRDIVASPRQYMSRRTKITTEYTIDSQLISVSSLQMEIDSVMELDNVVTIIEGKNGFPLDFATYQLFHPHLYYFNLQAAEELDIKAIQCCYLLRDKSIDGSILRLYLYRFHGRELASIELIRKGEYVLQLRDPV